MFYYTEWLLLRRSHIIAWLSFIIYETSVLGFYSGKFSNFWDYSIHYAINIALFYVHAHYTLPKAFGSKQNSFWKLPLFIAIEIVCYIAFVILIDSLIESNSTILGKEKFILDQQFYIGTLFRASYFIAFSTGYYYLLQFIQQSKRANDLEKVELNHIINTQKIEQDLLRSQINPHFLFNTLDFIHNNTRKISPSTAEAIAILSDMMRYSAHIQGEFITLADEIEQIDNIINLHQIKKNGSLNITFNYTQEVLTLEFIPFIIITLVENIFKHGNLLAEEHPASIMVDYKNGILSVETDNLISQNQNPIGLNSGLKNIEKRLAFNYGEKAKFSYSKNEEHHFKTTLTVIMA